MEFTVQEIAKSLEAEFFGDPKIKGYFDCRTQFGI